MILPNFEISQVNHFLLFEALLSGKYLVEIVNSKVKPSKTGDGKYLELEYVVLKGDYTGCKIRDRLHLNHPKPRVVEIAKKRLSAICRAVGVMKPSDSSELHHIPLYITVKAKKDEVDNTIYNEIKAYSKKRVIKRTAARTSSKQMTPSKPLTRHEYTKLIQTVSRPNELSYPKDYRNMLQELRDRGCETEDGTDFFAVCHMSQWRVGMNLFWDFEIDTIVDYCRKQKLYNRALLKCEKLGMNFYYYKLAELGFRQKTIHQI